MDAIATVLLAPARARHGTGGSVLRLFLHWEEPAGTRVDLDLSCTFFDAHWQKVGHCDYTWLRFAGSAAVHSGDFTSAPAPGGSTEFLDLDLAALLATRVRYAVPVVFSYDDVPFDTMTEAFAGFTLPQKKDGRFDGRRVAQRFDLGGDAKALMPMVIDVAERRMLWADLSLSVHGGTHAVEGHAGKRARAAADQWDLFANSSRPSVLDLARWHASGRADLVVDDGSDLGDVTGLRVFAAVAEADTLTGFASGRPANGSMAMTVTGRPDEPWQPVGPAELLAGLPPADE